MKRKFTAITLFIDFFEEHGRIPTREEFREMWEGCDTYYYKVKKQFLENLDFYIGK